MAAAVNDGLVMASNRKTLVTASDQCENRARNSHEHTNVRIWAISESLVRSLAMPTLLCPARHAGARSLIVSKRSSLASAVRLGIRFHIFPSLLVGLGTADLPSGIEWTIRLRATNTRPRSRILLHDL